MPSGPRMSEACRGSALVESLVALLLTTGLLILVGGLVVQHHKGARTLSHRIEGVESARVTRDLISLGLAADPGARVDGSELFVRTFVGVAVPCGEAGWRYQGRRLPDPERDSLWSVTAAGTIRLAALTAGRAGDSDDSAGARVLGLEADPPLSPEIRLVRVFESGRYRLDDAFRYGRVGSGAQPLSAAVLDPGRSGITRQGAGVTVSLVTRGRELGFTGGWDR